MTNKQAGRAERCPTCDSDDPREMKVNWTVMTPYRRSCTPRAHDPWHDAPPAASTGTPALCPGEDARECGPSETGLAEQRRKCRPFEWTEEEQAWRDETASLRAQLQERAREVLHLDNARQTLVDQLAASEAANQRLRETRHEIREVETTEDCCGDRTRCDITHACSCGYKGCSGHIKQHLFAIAMAQPEAGSDDGAWEQDRRRWREGNSF